MNELIPSQESLWGSKSQPPVWNVEFWPPPEWSGFVGVRRHSMGAWGQGCIGIFKLSHRIYKPSSLFKKKEGKQLLLQVNSLVTASQVFFKKVEMSGNVFPQLWVWGEGRSHLSRHLECQPLAWRGRGPSWRGRSNIALLSMYGVGWGENSSQRFIADRQGMLQRGILIFRFFTVKSVKIMRQTERSQGGTLFHLARASMISVAREENFYAS